MSTRSGGLWVAAVLAGCSAGPEGTRTPADLEREHLGNQLARGTEVCIGLVAGVRYLLEDVLREHALEPISSCTDADVEAAESGAEGSYVLRYRLIGESAWRECSSDAVDRRAFLAECIDRMKTDLGGGMATGVLTSASGG
jgi:hypothetical protein